MVKNNKKKQNSKKTIRKTKNLQRGGNCPCNKPLFNGGNGTASFQSFNELPKDSYYLPNTYQNDPTDPSIVVSSRNIHNPIFHGSNAVFLGGKRNNIKKSIRRNKSVRSKKVKFSRKMKIYKGGNLLGNPSNAVLSFGTSSGNSELINLSSVAPQVDPSPHIQPALNMFSSNRYPLV
jgi:hypothetical protein